MKSISLGILAILLAGATVFANGPVAKNVPSKIKQECRKCPAGKCLKEGKAMNCPDKASCADKADCQKMAACSDKCCS